MSRPVMLSNGGLMVGLSEHGLVHDFYYPYVGLENLTNSRNLHHKMGVWVDGQFSWVDDGSWQISVDFEADALISSCTLSHTQLGIELNTKDFVDSEQDVFCRVITVKNASAQTKDVRLFMHQVFEISRRGRADTALFVPDPPTYIYDYKGHCMLLISAKRQSDGALFDQYAVGNFRIEGKDGSYRDAEDGELSDNNVEHGGVDSVLRFKQQLEPGTSEVFEYIVVAATSQYDGEALLERFEREGITQRMVQTRQSHQKWLSTAAAALADMSEPYRIAVQKSLLLIWAHTDKRGSILASGDSSIYNYGRDYYCYFWPRDGAYAVWPLIRLGYTEEIKRFFQFCQDVMHPDGYMLHKYQPDRSVGSTWHPLLHNKRKELAIQEDETAIVVFMLTEFYAKSGDRAYMEMMYPSLLKPMSNFLAKFIDDDTNLPHPSYDLWEERFMISSYTSILVAHTLSKAVILAREFGYHEDADLWEVAANRLRNSINSLYNADLGYFIKGLYRKEDTTIASDSTLDCSAMYAALMFGQGQEITDELAATVRAVENKLSKPLPIGGVIRYENDNYMRVKNTYPGNPWPVCTLWLAQYYVHNGEAEKGRSLIDWTLGHSLSSGAISEQVDPETGFRIGVTPLVWSHAELINTILDYTAVQKKD